MKALVLAVLLSCGLYASEDKPSLVVQINPVLVSSNDPEVCTVMYTNQRFILIKEHEVIALEKSDVDEQLHKIHTCKDLAEYLSHGNALKVIKNEQGLYRLEALIKLKGGGPILMTLGFVGVHTVGFTLMFTSILGINVALPGVGTAATAAAGGGSVATWMAAQNALAVKAACGGALVLPWL